jgi:hypothetical protein
MAESETEAPGVGRGYAWLGVVALLMAGLVYFRYFFPHEGIGPEQPIYFSHRVHAGVKEIHCRFCHPYVDRSHHAGLPEVAKCFFCHNYIIPQHPQIVKERWHYENKVPVPWVRIYYVPDHVKFNHQPHILRGIDCAVCHGEVKRLDRLIPVDFKMGFCIGCHRSQGVQVDCWLACHN